MKRIQPQDTTDEEKSLATSTPEPADVKPESNEPEPKLLPPPELYPDPADPKLFKFPE